MQTTEKQPLILTLRLDQNSQEFFNRQREMYFPKERNYLQAHLMIFHQLPNNDSTRSYLQNFEFMLFNISVAGLMRLGAGVAYKTESSALIKLHAALKNHFINDLILQDRQGFRPHITIQNKVLPEQAKTLHAELSLSFKPFEILATDLDLWLYLGGPWKHEATFDFLNA